MLQLLANEITLYNDTHNVNKLAPYHNTEHMAVAYVIAKQLWEIEKQDPNYVMSAPEEVMEVILMLGVLFHDVNHSGGRLTDRENILWAIKELKQFCLIHSQVMNGVFTKKYPDWAAPAMWAAVGIIDCTEFPFVKHPATKLECIMRDADVLYTAFVGDPKLVMEDLRTEISTARNYAVTYEEMVIGQSAFVKNITMYTKAGQAMWDRLAQPYMDKLCAYALEHAEAIPA
jgi:hypothetical protein